MPRNNKPRVRNKMHVAPGSASAGSNIGAIQNTPAWKQRQEEQKTKQAAALKLNPLRKESEGTTAAAAAAQGAQGAALAAASFPYGPVSNPFYQVGKSDKSLNDVANATGASLSFITEQNKTKSLPPKGSYLQVGPYAGPSSFNAAAGAGQMNQAINRIKNPPKPTPRDYGDDMALLKHRQYSQAQQISTQLANGQLPSTIPISSLQYLTDANGQTTTLQDWLAEGYTIKNGQLVKGGGGSNSLGGPAGAYTPTYADPRNDPRNTKAYQYYAEKETPFTEQLRWDPTVRKFVSIGKLLKQGKLKIDKPGTWFYPRGNKQYQRKRRDPNEGYTPAAPAAAPITAEGPTILDIHLGSG